MAPATLKGPDRTETAPALEDPGARTPHESPDDWSPTPEDLAAVKTTVARMRAAYPSVDASTVEATVEAAYDSFRQAKVRRYVPILAERRSRKVLTAGSTPDQVRDGP
ncbi:three-helix bundle dimerization domain-containing protein [Streptomyces sp. NRRL S-237]|uniref:three-helix bundle dimerization domain-containing protein n=1 Tax=Streptomyces sp. NRRL S-237 TaxID=1463895 RepID=UPI0004C87CC9|nr:hypothetical protein [Streptomyces sp. NRRL S-237]